MSTLSQLVDETLIDLTNYGARNDRATFLSADITATATVWTVVDGGALTQGIAEVGDELVYVESVSGNTVTIAPDGRGFYGTTPAAATANARVTMSPVWPRSRVAAALNDAIEGTWPTLYGVGTSTFTWNGVRNTYDMPTGTQQIVSVVATWPTPTREPQRIHRYALTPGAVPVLTIEEGVYPGATVTVTYQKEPSAIALTDDLTASGLRSTAKLAVKYAAMSQLTAGMDGERLVSETAQGYEFGTQTPVGTASKISAQYYQRYQIELDSERRRLSKTNQPPISWRSR